MLQAHARQFPVRVSRPWRGRGPGADQLSNIARAVASASTRASAEVLGRREGWIACDEGVGIGLRAHIEGKIRGDLSEQAVPTACASPANSPARRSRRSSSAMRKPSPVSSSTAKARLDRPAAQARPGCSMRPRPHGRRDRATDATARARSGARRGSSSPSRWPRDADLDDRRRHQDVHLVPHEAVHDRVLLAARQPAVEQRARRGPRRAAPRERLRTRQPRSSARSRSRLPLALRRRSPARRRRLAGPARRYAARTRKRAACALAQRKVSIGVWPGGNSSRTDRSKSA